MVSTTCFPCSALRPVIATAAPSRAKRTAVALPIPEVPPVIRKVDPDRLLAELRDLLEEASSDAIWNREPFRDIPDELKRVNDIAFSGDGEPTTYKNFDEILAACADVKRRHELPDLVLLPRRSGTVPASADAARRAAERRLSLADSVGW